MSPRKPKTIAPKRRSGKVSRPRKPQRATPSQLPTPIEPKVKLKPNLKAFTDPQLPVDKWRNTLDALALEDTAAKGNDEQNKLSGTDEQGARRGDRQRVRRYQPDMAFGSEMDNLIKSSVYMGRMKEEEDVNIRSHPPTILSLRAPARLNSSETVHRANPPLRDHLASQEVYDILNVLQSSSNVQVDLPDMTHPGDAGVIKPYTARLLTDLYIQCYKNQLWHLCDLVADTWIRALQSANKRTQRSKDMDSHMWRRNVPLEKKFAEKKKGFKSDVFEFRLDVEDPELAVDVTTIDPELLRDLFAHTDRDCGARLLWADAIALRGKYMEHEIVKGPSKWPLDLFFDIMCTSLRMVGRKLTLKIEEAYEGAWCRYHEHDKHGLPCYRRLAWIENQCQERSEKNGIEAEKETNSAATKGNKRAHWEVDGDEQDGAKRVRFDSGAQIGAEVIDFGELDAEGESDSE